MATIEDAIYSLLSSDGPLSALVDTRIDPILVPQSDAMPAVTFKQLPSSRDDTLGGPTGLVRSQWEFTCWGAAYADARAVADALRQAISGYDGTVLGVVIQAVMAPSDEHDVPANPAGKNVARRYGKALEFTIWFCETP